jgi:hypothetical protein
MSKNSLNFEFVWKSLNIETQTGYFLIFEFEYFPCEVINWNNWKKLFFWPLGHTEGPQSVHFRWPLFFSGRSLTKTKVLAILPLGGSPRVYFHFIFIQKNEKTITKNEFVTVY